MKLNRIITLLILGISILLLASCPTPLSLEKLALLQDLDAPEITLTSPKNYSEYATVIELSGSLKDTLLETPPEGTELTVSYSIPGTSISGTLPVSTENGSFSGMLNVSTLSGDKVIEVSAVDLNGNISTISVNIVKPEDGGDISGFTVTPGNRQVTISWDPVPGAESYSIFELFYDDEITSEQITGTSYTWTGLDNWKIYNFQLTAHLPEEVGEDAYSTEVTTMPLSASSLTPVITNTDYKTISLEWPAVDNLDKYIIERSNSPLGPWKTSIITSKKIFTDKNVDNDSSYYYRVVPFGFQDISSLSTGGKPARFTGDDIIASVPPPGAITPYSLQIDENYAYIANFRDGFAIFDIADPSHPVNISSYGVASTFEFRDIFVRDNIAFLAGYDDGLLLIDISDVDNPVLLSSCSTPGNALGVYADANYAYIADDSGRLSIIDISDPTSVSDSSLKSGCDTTGIADKVIVKDGYAYVAADGLEIIDVSSPLSVDDSSTAGSCSSIGNGLCKDLCISGDYLYMVQGPPLFPATPDGPSALQIVDISSPGSVTDLSVEGSIDLSGDAEGVTIAGSFVYIAVYDDDLQIIDVSDPAAPALERQYTTPGQEQMDVKVSGDFAYVADRYGGGLVVIDLVKPRSPSIAASAPTYRASDIKIFDDYAYIADHYEGLKIIDISEPEGISAASDIISCTLPDDALALEIRYPYAFIAAEAAGLVIVDISNPLQPELLSSTETTGYATDLYIRGNYAYISDKSSSLEILDITFPEAPEIISTCDCETSNFATGITVSEDFAYICTGSDGLQVVNISDPYSPFKAAECSAGGAEKVAISGDYAVVTSMTNGSGIHIIDISDPAGIDDTSLIASLGITGFQPNIEIAGDFAYVSGSTRLTVVDITNPESPSSFSYCALPHYGYGVSVSGEYAYIADYTAGLQIINLSGE